MKAIVIGNSAAALNAAKTFRQYDQASDLTLISKEAGPAYSRVLLPYFLRGKLDYDKMFFLEQDFYEKLRIDTRFGQEVLAVEPAKRRLSLADGETLPYDCLLIATGASPTLPPIENLGGPGVSHMWTLGDALALAPYFCPGKRVLILGSGFIALQAAWAALNRGMRATVYELMPRIMPQVLDEAGAGVLAARIAAGGVDLNVNTCTQRVERQPDGTLRVFANGREPLDVDLIIVATGVCPNIALLKGSGIRTERGILVNERMETNIPGIYAAGDVVQGPTTFCEPHIIHALWPTAVEEGKIAGANMAGQSMAYQGSLNMNVTEMFGITVASMGRFCECGSERKEEYSDPANGRYAKLVFDGDRLMGGIVLGKSEDVALLGLIRPLIRLRKQPDEIIARKLGELLASYR